MKDTVIKRWSPIIGVFLLLLLFFSCQKEAIVSIVSNKENITSYIDKNADKFSEFRKILEITGSAGFLQAYGNYTLFLPTNDGIKKYLAENGKSSVDQVPLDSLKDIVRFHLLEDTVSTINFGDGKLSSPTMLGEYLITGASNIGGLTSTTVNRQANIEVSNIRLGNGYVHVIDNLLRPSKYTLAKLIELDGRFTIFTEALKETGLYDTLNVLPVNNPDTAKRYLTVLAETDVVLGNSGISSYSALKSTYDKTDIKDLKDYRNGLHSFMAYHILFDAKYFADISTASAHATLAKPEIITTEFKNDQILVNDVIFAKKYEPGFLIRKDESDNAASNGVFHVTGPYTPVVVPPVPPTTGHFEIKKREPFRVDWNLADFKESRSHPNFQKPGATAFDFRKTSKTAPSPLTTWDWGNTIYGPNYTNAGATDAYVHRDYLNLPIGVSSRNDWMSAKTPLIVRGAYYVWVCYRRQLQSKTPWPANVGTKCRILIDGVPLSKSFFFGEPAPLGSSAELASVGWKYYTSNGNATAPFTKQTYDAAGNAASNPWVAKNLGVIEIKSTEEHLMRMEAQLGSQSTNNIDMIQFIPVKAESQILPRFRQDGTEDWTDYPGTH